MLLAELVRDPDDYDPDRVFESFVDWSVERGWEPYAAQTEALIEIVTGSNVIMATPTGSGKSLVATGAQFATLNAGGTVYYTAPIKALVSEKFFTAVEYFGPERVGMLTGDASVNAGAPIICCTAEVLANLSLRRGADADITTVIMDEFHFYAEPDRGWAWQVPLIELPKAQFVLMSATLGDVTRFENDLARRTGRSTAVISSTERPIPLSYRYVTTTLHETIEECLASKDTPVYVVHFSRAAAIEQAQAMASLKVASREEKEAVAELIGDFRFSAGFGRTLSRLVRMGIGVHHSGMLPRYRRLVERLAQAGLLKIICGTDTLGVGINVPIRTVLLTSLSKYDGVKPRLLTAREFHQIAGRAGRAGYDTHGTVLVQAPDHVVANEKALAKVGDDPKKRRKVVRKKPPEGTVGYGEPTFERLVGADPEPLESSFAVSHAMMINVISRGGDCYAGMRRLLTDNDEPPVRRRRHVHRSIQIYRGLLASGVVEPDPYGLGARLTVELQSDFALNQALSPFALAALELVDLESPDYALDVVSVIESILEDPRPVLMAQRNRARGAAVEAMKAEGIEYEQRMELLEEVTHPKPLAELLEHAYTLYAGTHPWVLDHRLSPKSVVRELAEQAMTFSQYVSDYQLARSEGIVLRYLSDAYKALRQTVPETRRSPDLADLIEWLGELVRQVDSSLVDEWEQLRDPSATVQSTDRPIDDRPPPVTRNTRAFTVLVRNALFRRVELAARRRWAELGELDGESGLDADAWWSALEPYFVEHGEIGTGPDARGPALLAVEKHPDRWEVRQTLDDPAGDRDWVIEAVVELAASDDLGEASVRIVNVGRLDLIG